MNKLAEARMREYISREAHVTLPEPTQRPPTNAKEPALFSELCRFKELDAPWWVGLVIVIGILAFAGLAYMANK